MNENNAEVELVQSAEAIAASKMIMGFGVVLQNVKAIEESEK